MWVLVADSRGGDAAVSVFYFLLTVLAGTASILIADLVKKGRKKK